MQKAAVITELDFRTNCVCMSIFVFSYILNNIDCIVCCSLFIKQSNLRFPLGKQHFSTTSREVYTVKPLVLQRPARSQCSSLSFALK